MGSQDSTVVMRTGYMVPADTTAKKPLKNMGDKILDKLIKQSSERRTIPMGGGYMVPVDSSPNVKAKGSSGTEDLFNEWMKKINKKSLDFKKSR